MKERAGLIIMITGVILLIKPNFDIEQIVMSFNYVVANYWPVALVFIGLFLVNPKKKKTRSR